MVKSYYKCQRLGNRSNCSEMPLTYILEVELFDAWDIDFMGPFPPFNGYMFILVAVDYVSKWVEAISYPTSDAKVVIKFLIRNVFTRFGMPNAIISDEGSHLINRAVASLLARYNIKHKVATIYHSQSNGQAEISNKDIKSILEKMVNISRKDWAFKQDEAIWAYRTTFKTPLGTSPTNWYFGSPIICLQSWSIKLFGL